MMGGLEEVLRRLVDNEVQMVITGGIAFGGVLTGVDDGIAYIQRAKGTGPVTAVRIEHIIACSDQNPAPPKVIGVGGGNGVLQRP